MKVKVATASGPVLDWMVAKAAGLEPRIVIVGGAVIVGVDGLQAPSYSTDWSQGGPILSDARISRTIDHSGLWIAYWTDGYTEGDEGKKWMQCNRSELVAGLRCYVASKLGEEVEVPDELA